MNKDQINKLIKEMIQQNDLKNQESIKNELDLQKQFMI